MFIGYQGTKAIAAFPEGVFAIERIDGEEVKTPLAGEQTFHVCKPPRTAVFYEPGAEGCWVDEEDGELRHFVQVAGQSGIYLIVTRLRDGKEIRNTVPWG